VLIVPGDKRRIPPFSVAVSLKQPFRAASRPTIIAQARPVSGAPRKILAPLTSLRVIARSPIELG
jgi:hypothetical protein